MSLLRVDRPVRVSRGRYGDWCWTCWCCPAPGCWTTHTAGNWADAVAAADGHVRTEHPHHNHNDNHDPDRQVGGQDDRLLGRAA